MEKGSISIFLALTLLIIFSLIFALLESSRVAVMQAKCELVSQSSLESAFAGYHRELWEQYGLLLTEKTGVEGKICEALRFAEENDETLCRCESEEMQMVMYQLATDGGGSAYVEQISQLLKYRLPAEAVRKVYENAAAGEEYLDGAKEQSILESAKEARQRAVEMRQAESGGEGTNSNVEANQVMQQAPQENPIEKMERLKCQPMLTLVLGENAENISNHTISREQQLEHRVRQQGTMGSEENRDWYMKTMFTIYCQMYFGNYLSARQERPLAYEMEYLVGGKTSDRENLERTIEKLVLLRELINFADSVRDSAKCAQAKSLAVVLTGGLGGPAIVSAVQYGILLAWAFSDSLEDVKTLLAGGEAALPGGTMLDYVGYLEILLMAVPVEELYYRGADLIGNHLGISMDEMVQQARVRYVFRASPLYSRFVTLTEYQGETYQFCCQEKYSYLE